MAQRTTLSRRPSAAWSRLKAPPVDRLEDVGLPSKGDNRLLDFAAQDIYYGKIVARYMEFCAGVGRGDDALEKAFAAMKIESSRPAPQARGGNAGMGAFDPEPAAVKDRAAASNKELSVILMAMRKLREGLVASGRVDHFAQQAYIFIIRAAILMGSFESYQPALLRLLTKIHSTTPLSRPDRQEFVGYHILDLACRMAEYGEAYVARKRWCFADGRVDGVLTALVRNDWPTFWRLRAMVDGYQRKLMGWAENGIRKHTLKCLGKSYLTLDKSFVETCAGRGWQELKEKDGVGWELDGQKVTIRRVRAK